MIPSTLTIILFATIGENTAGEKDGWLLKEQLGVLLSLEQKHRSSFSLNGNDFL